MKVKIKNRSHRYNKNRPWSRHECKYTEYKKLKKSVAYKKSAQLKIEQPIAFEGLTMWQ